MRNLEKLEHAFNYFKKSYQYKMGGTQTVILPNGKSKYFDDREYYSGRGAKYNSDIKHDEIGDVEVSKKEYSAFLKKLKEREEAQKTHELEQAEKLNRIQNAIRLGVYTVSMSEYSNYIELSEDEAINQHFDVKRLAKTLKIKEADAKLLNTTGKTYVFAKQIDSEKIVMLFHPSLSCNELSISFEFVTEEYVSNFRKDWGEHGEFAEMLGQTKKENHFVC